MPSIKDKSTVEAIARIYYGEGKRNKTETLKIVGYKPSYYKTRGLGVVYSNVRVKEAMKAVEAETMEKHEHNQEIAINLLKSDYARLCPAADGGNIQAIQARTAIVRELNAITGQHSTTIITDDVQARALDAKQQAEADRIAGIRLSGAG